MKSFLDLRYLNRLILSNNLLTHIESGTFSLIYLHVLELANNKLTELQSDFFNGLPFLAIVDLHGNKLTSPPPNLFSSQRLSLIAMDFSRNNIADLPPNIFERLDNLRVLILDNNDITSLQPGMFEDLKSLWWLYLDDNNLTTIVPDTFKGLSVLFRLHISGNKLTTLNPDMFKGAETLKELLISRNELTSLPEDVFSRTTDLLQLSLDKNLFEHMDLRPFISLRNILIFNMSGNHIEYLGYMLQKSHNSSLDNNSRTIFPKLKAFEVNDNKIDKIDVSIFIEMPTISSIQLRGNPLKRVDKSTFKPLIRNDTYVLVDDPATCCFIDTAQCKAQNTREPYLTCMRLLPNVPIRVFMWIFGLFAFVGNVSVLLWRCLKHGRENVVQVLLIENLAASDLLMGIYMLIIASADAYYQQYFPSESDDWRNGPICKLAGTLSTLSSEASVFFITLISIDRFLAIKFPRGTQRLTKKSAKITLFCLWCLAIVLSVIPTSFSGVNPDFYDVSEVCIGLPFVRAPVFFNETVIAAKFDLEDYNSISSGKESILEEDYIFPVTGDEPGLYFSIVLFLGLNFLCFLVIVVCYIWIFVLYKQATARTGTSSTDKELSLAIRMGAIVLTDFMCWLPIVMIGILVQSATVTISPVVYVYIVVFILPINSAVNPYIYTVAIIISDYRARPKATKSTKVTELTARKKNSESRPSTSGNTSSTPNTASTSDAQSQLHDSTMMP